MDFDWLLFYLCLGTIIVHIRTLFFLPYQNVPKIVDNYDMMQDGFIIITAIYGILYTSRDDGARRLLLINQEGKFL